MPVKPNISFENLEVAFASKSNAELKKMYLIFATVNNNLAVSVGTKLANWSFALGLPIKGIMKKTMFGHFSAVISSAITSSITTRQALPGGDFGEKKNKTANISK